MKKIMILLVMAAMLVSLAGCGGKEEEKKASPAPGTMGMPPGMGAGGSTPSMPPAMGGGGMPPGMGGGEGMPPGMGQRSATAPKQVVVPESVKKAWPASKILVKKKSESGEGKTYEVAADKSITIPGTKLRVEVGQYLPDFFMDGQSITSKSDTPVNPTVQMKIYDGDKEIYKGWAFEKYPDAHAFTHPDYIITLAGGVKAK